MSEALRVAADKIRLWREKPHVFVREVFGVTPDAWQDDVLAAFPTSPRMAMKACKGPGKTSVLAWIGWNFLLTRPHPKIAATSISADNLTDGLWTEMAKWQNRSPLLLEAFNWTKTRIVAKDHPETWYMSARSWSRSASREQQADTLAGLHADYMLFLIDEAGGIPDAVMAAAEAGLANAVGDNEAHIVMAGNPTHLEGPLYRSCTSERRLWHVTEITSDPDDPKRTPRVSAQWAREQIEKYGIDNPWVLVNVFGRFPPSSLNALIGPEEVREAMGRHAGEDQYRGAARILGVDVAREGDDSSIIYPRQGIAAFKPIALRNVDSIQGAGALLNKWTEWEADAAFVDNTGGFGAGWIDQARSLGRDPIGVHFAGSPLNPQYANKRAEMWFELVQWIRNGGCLPDDPDLLGELCAATYYFKGDKFALIEKDQIKAKIGRSPDRADALGLTFAFPVAPRGMARPGVSRAMKQEYDPFMRLN
jgi:hypothetical protein